MIKRLFSCFNSSRPSSPPKSTDEHFQLFKKDGKYFADPKSLHTLDKFESHKAAAEELNGYLSLLKDVKSAVGSLEGTQADKNLRPDVVAVDDLDVGGKNVDAILSTSNDKCGGLEARIEDGNSTIMMGENLYPLTQFLRIQNGNTSYKVDNAFNDSYVTVTRTEKEA